jgi:hypothetical protein
VRVVDLRYLWAISIVLLLLSADVKAQHTIDGLIGVDLHAISSTSESHENSYPTVDATRLMSNHFVSFANQGNIKNEQFAKYSLSTRLKGFFTAMNSKNLEESSYAAPSLNMFSGAVSFFPMRSYYLNLYYLKMKELALRYNQTNRAKTELLTPGLAVLQKNRIDATKYGSSISSKLSERASITAAYNESSTQNSYDYDFAENKNIIITSLDFPGDIYTNTVPITFTNNIDDDSVRIVSGIINEIIPPGFSSTIVFDTGFHFIDIIPLHTYNQSSISIDANREQRFLVTIDVEDYPAQGDIIDDISNTEVEFVYKGRSLDLNTSYFFEDALRKSQGAKETNSEIKNSLRYGLTRALKLAVRTEKTRRENTSKDNQTQTVDDFKNHSILSFDRRRGLAGDIGHQYGKSTNTNPEGIEDKTTDTKLSSRISLPTNRLKHNTSLSGELSFQDMAGTTNSNSKNKSATLTNTMELFYKGIKLVPTSSIRATSRHRTTDSVVTEGSEQSISSTLEGSRQDTRLLGDVSSKLSHSFTKTVSDSKTKDNSSIIWELMFSKDISENQSISIRTSHSWGFTGDVDVVEVDTISRELTTTTLKTPTRYENASSIGYTSTQFEDIDFSTSLAMTNAPGVQTVNITISLETYIPFIRFPFSSEIAKQYRSLEGLPGQTSFRMESLISYRFNQINLKITHLYAEEKLVLDTYKFYELSVGITRTFGMW